MSKTYFYVGNWSFQANPAKGKGISIFEYAPETGEMKMVETICPEAAAGYITLDETKGMLYSNDERGERHCGRRSLSGRPLSQAPALSRKRWNALLRDEKASLFGHRSR